MRAISLAMLNFFEGGLCHLHGHPGGMLDNSPTLQRWVGDEWRRPVPKGRLNRSHGIFSRPFGTGPHEAPSPNAEALGYCRLSLRDNPWRSGYLPEVQFHEIDDAYDRIIGQIVKMTDQPEKWLIRPHDAP